MKLLDLLTDPVRLPLALAFVAALARVVYAIVSRVVQPYPRARAALEAVVALLPDVLRAGLQLVAVATGRPAPRLDVTPLDPQAARAINAAESWRLRAELAEARVAELTVSDEPGRPRPTVVPAEAAPVVTSRHRIATRPEESGRAQLWALALVMLVGLAACPRLPPVSGCEPLSHRCEGDRPQVCSPSRRWHFVGDERCDASPGQSCQVRNAVAGCAR